MTAYPSPTFAQTAASFAQNAANTAFQDPRVRERASQYGITPEMAQQGIGAAGQYFNRTQAPAPYSEGRSVDQTAFRAAAPKLFEQLSNPEFQQSIGAAGEQLAELTPQGAAISKGIKLARLIAIVVGIIATILVIVMLGLAINESNNSKSALGYEIGALVSAIIAILAFGGLAIGDWYRHKRQRDAVSQYTGPLTQFTQMFRKK